MPWTWWTWLSMPATSNSGPTLYASRRGQPVNLAGSQSHATPDVSYEKEGPPIHLLPSGGRYYAINRPCGRLNTRVFRRSGSLSMVTGLGSGVIIIPDDGSYHNTGRSAGMRSVQPCQQNYAVCLVFRNYNKFQSCSQAWRAMRGGILFPSGGTRT
jgi:hypothetical protein